jgi:hypothetical protein
MKWKIMAGGIVLTLILAALQYFGVFQIPLLIILTPLIIGSIVVFATTFLSIAILILIWILIYIFVISKLISQNGII